MKKRFLQFFFGAAFVLVSLSQVACSNDDDALIEPEYPEQGEFHEIAVLNFVDFLSDNDVRINSLDDTLDISVSRPYLSSIQPYVNSKRKELAEGTYLVVWRSDRELPFVRYITSVDNSNSTHVRLKMDRADFIDVLPDGDYHLNTSLYTNPNEPQRVNGDINPNITWSRQTPWWYITLWQSLRMLLCPITQEKRVRCYLPRMVWNMR